MLKTKKDIINYLNNESYYEIEKLIYKALERETMGASELVEYIADNDSAKYYREFCELYARDYLESEEKNEELENNADVFDFMFENLDIDAYFDAVDYALQGTWNNYKNKVIKFIFNALEKSEIIKILED